MASRRKAARKFSGIIARGCMGSVDDKRILDFRFWIFGLRGKGMKLKSLKGVRNSFSDNPKSAIQNPKWAGLLALALGFTVVCGAVADAQQTGKIFRIGFLD